MNCCCGLCEYIIYVSNVDNQTNQIFLHSYRMSVRGDRPGWGGPGIGLGGGKDPNRRWSMALSSMGYSHASAQSLHSIGDNHPRMFMQ